MDNRQILNHAQRPHSHSLMMGERGRGPSDFFRSEILAKSKFFWVYERRQDFFGSQKKTEGLFGVAKKGLRDFLCMLKKVVIVLGRQILKL